MMPDQKDFVNSVKFLKVDDNNDRLLTGISSEIHDEMKIEALFDVESKGDLTTQLERFSGWQDYWRRGIRFCQNCSS